MNALLTNDLLLGLILLKSLDDPFELPNNSAFKVWFSEIPTLDHLSACLACFTVPRYSRGIPCGQFSVSNVSISY